jgi:hypothetical protein
MAVTNLNHLTGRDRGRWVLFAQVAAWLGVALGLVSVFILAVGSQGL